MRGGARAGAGRPSTNGPNPVHIVVPRLYKDVLKRLAVQMFTGQVSIAEVEALLERD